ncbi:MAG: dTDP-4-dehydrorhamnose 3,5-epimerase [Motiliproteus sp.]|nr:dTDP-4-dehydrorhamnose 3,5-epimerase [Motiliproteus sp.]MCW9052532.1 dTDP-4-dehydrorhamnose 3,5-epimerase [Motiliproteus sp.]
MKTVDTDIPEVKIIEPTIFEDARGFFFESFNEKVFSELIGSNVFFVQDNHSCSVQGILRGMHYQVQKPQGKLVRVINGSICDVVVDLRKKSNTYLKYVMVRLSSRNKRMLWAPEGFAHGFMVLSENAEVLYKATDYWAPEFERIIAWNDPDLNIKWPSGLKPVLSEKDSKANLVRYSEVFE